MKILYHHRIGSKDGQFVHIEELTNALSALGHEIIMVGPQVARDEAFGGESKFVAFLKSYLPKALYELLEFAYSFADYRVLARMVRRHQPDFIYERYNLFWLSGIWVKRRLKVPLIMEVNAPLFDERSRYNGIALRRLARFSERAAWRGADQVITVTKVLAERIAAAGVSMDGIVVTPNGINLKRFPDTMERTAAKRRLGLENAVVLGFVGFAREWHGLERVLNLLAEHPERNWHFLLVGDGQARTTLEKISAEKHLQDRFTITGIVARDEVANYVRAFDIALQPAVVDYASPLKLFEYMACRCAIVAPNKANIREILTNDEDSLLFEPVDPTHFTAAVEQLCEDPALRGRLGDNARRTLIDKELTWRHNAEIVECVAKQLNVHPAERAPA